jgi:hypothetical protein
LQNERIPFRVERDSFQEKVVRGFFIEKQLLYDVPHEPLLVVGFPFRPANSLVRENPDVFPSGVFWIRPLYWLTCADSEWSIASLPQETRA